MEIKWEYFMGNSKNGSKLSSEISSRAINLKKWNYEKSELY
jgi:hypothetical protein